MSNYSLPIMRSRPKLFFVGITLLPALLYTTEFLAAFPAVKAAIGSIACCALGVVISEHIAIWEPEMTHGDNESGSAPTSDLGAEETKQG